jgi:hypothetical protein
MLTIGVTLAILCLFVSVFLEGLFRTTDWFDYSLFDNNPFIIICGFMLSICMLVWFVTLPILIIALMLYFSGIKLGKVLNSPYTLF